MTDPPNCSIRNETILTPIRRQLARLAGLAFLVQSMSWSWDTVDMKKSSVVGKDYHTDEQVVGCYNAGDRMKYWGKLGALWGGLWGLLLGAAFL